MNTFPRTVVGGVSVPRLLIGSNWFLGYSHTSVAKDRWIREYFNRARIADIIEVYLRYDIDAVMSPPNELLAEAIDEAQQRASKRMIWICTPWKLEEIDWSAEKGVTFCFPHQSVVDPRVDRANGVIHEIENWSREVRARGMIPGLSTHMPESILLADKTGLDVESYIQPYNAAGFLCPIETDWVAKIIREAKKPVMTIKPLAAGRLLPPTGLAFVWSTIRDVDMVTIGTMSPYEAEEDIELSLALLERRKAEVELQVTRSKSTVT
jgi:hypothetical protein